jgi:hypothetical protein
MWTSQRPAVGSSDWLGVEVPCEKMLICKFGWEALSSATSTLFVHDVAEASLRQGLRPDGARQRQMLNFDKSRAGAERSIRTSGYKLSRGGWRSSVPEFAALRPGLVSFRCRRGLRPVISSCRRVCPPPSRYSNCRRNRRYC